MTKIQKLIIVSSVFVGLLLVGGALLYSQNQTQARIPRKIPQRTVGIEELKRADGKDGRDCLVAVAGTVYLIEDFTLWQDGEHKTSNGQAYCGADLTKAIEKSPHGKSKLDVLTKVGPLKS